MARPSRSAGTRRPPRVHLIDAHVYIFRAYFALPDMAAPDGTATHAAYGFASTLLRFLSEVRPTHVAAAFDFALTSFRNELEPSYKEGRGEPPEDLEHQFDLCAEAAEALGVPVFQAEGYEADDVIATLAGRLRRRGARIEIVSSDKDLCQLVTEDDGVVFHDFARGRKLDADAVEARYGVRPDRFCDLQGLVGDAVDNLPGVPGVGPKTAAALLRRFGSIERIPRDAGRWTGVAVREAEGHAARIAAHRERALRTRRLARLCPRVPGLRVSLDRLRYRGADTARADVLCERLGWRGLRGRIASEATGN